MLITELIFADVHELLCRDEPGVGASLGVGLGLAGPAERLEGRVVDELGVFDNLKEKVQRSG